MPRVNVIDYMDSPFWIDSSCWASVLLMRWCQTGAAYSRTGRITGQRSKYTQSGFHTHYYHRKI